MSSIIYLFEEYLLRYYPKRMQTDNYTLRILEPQNSKGSFKEIKREASPILTRKRSRLYTQK